MQESGWRAEPEGHDGGADLCLLSGDPEEVWDWDAAATTHLLS